MNINTVLTEKEMDGVNELIVYTDGSTAPGNPGPSGYGGYGVDNKGNTYNLYGSIGDKETNNVAELTAIIKVLCFVKYSPYIKKVEILSDSRYSLDGIKMISKWESRGWLKSNGEPVKNKELFQELGKLVKDLTNISLSLKWVKGHNGIHGNEYADLNADKGRELLVEYPFLENGEVNILKIFPPPSEIESDEDEVVPKVKVEKIPKLNPMLNGKRWFFYSKGDLTIADGRYIYNTTTFEDKDKDEKRGKNLGKRAADTHYSIYLTKNPIVELDAIRSIYTNSVDNEVVPIVADLTVIKKRDIWSDIYRSAGSDVELKGKMATTLTGIVIAELQRPPKLIFKLDKIFNFGLNAILRYESIGTDGKCTDDVTLVDITDLLLDTNDKGKQSMVDTFTQKTRCIELKDIILTKDNIETIPLNIGTDIPLRNSFTGLINLKRNIKVTLMVWDITDVSYRCATIVEQENEISFHFTPDSNFKLRKESE